MSATLSGQSEGLGIERHHGISTCFTRAKGKGRNVSFPSNRKDARSRIFMSGASTISLQGTSMWSYVLRTDRLDGGGLRDLRDR